VLTTIDFDDDALLEANEVENEVSEGDLTTKFESSKPSVAEQSPHSRFCFGWIAPHLLGELADPFGYLSMVRRLWHQPLTRRLRRPLSHKGIG